MSDGIVWEEPSPDGRHYRKYQMDERLKPLREHPGRWARIMTVPSGSASSITSRIIGGRYEIAQPAGSFEAVSRRTGDRQVRAVYARYVGAPDETIPDPSAASGAGADGGGGARSVPGRSASAARDDASGGSRRPGQPTRAGEAS